MGYTFHGFEPRTWTRTLDPFGVIVQCRRVQVCKVKRLRHGTGNYVHSVDDAVLEWVEGAPKMSMRYLLTCHDMREQIRAHILPPSAEVTCRKCLYILRYREDDRDNH